VINKPWLEALISAGALAGCTSVLRSFSLDSRVSHSHGARRAAPEYFSRIHPRFRTPHMTTIWTGIVVAGVAMVTDIGSLADLTNIGTLLRLSWSALG
jgi:APA family basic amino acid/polyamine antiporter